MILTGAALMEAAEEALYPEPEPPAFGPISVDVHVSEDVEAPAKGYATAPAQEVIEMPNDLAALLTGRSTHMRGGLFMPGGWVDPGYEGALELEWDNAADEPARLEAGDVAGRLVFFECARATNGYQGRYGKRE